ncbi:hypothetical protein EJ110_NYTH18238 [Nymphaea thermarum]|nr:hypothetical protein EJ110_NYTH18238 [Nymphaea thermarum]
MSANFSSERPAITSICGVDGCFMLELLRTADPDRDEPYETVFNKAEMVSITVVQRDMLMLENQIPFLVIKKLVEVETGCLPHCQGHLQLLIRALFPNRFGFTLSRAEETLNPKSSPTTLPCRGSLASCPTSSW